MSDAVRQSGSIRQSQVRGSDGYDEEEPPENERTASGWRLFIIWGGAALLVLLIVILFTGRVTILNRLSGPKPEPLRVTMPTVEKPLDRGPVIRQAPASAPGARPAPRPNLPGGFGSDEQKKALESNMGLFFASNATAAAAQGSHASAKGVDENGLPAANQPDALEASLKPSKIDGVRVSETPNPRWMIETGRVLTCNQQTRLDSTLPGGITALLDEPVRGETGDVILLPKGSRVTGQLTTALVNGLDRVGVLWTKIRTPVLYNASGMPKQFDLDVNSPASDDLGTTGLDGYVNRHLVKKIGGIIGLSLVQGGIQAATNLASRSQNSNGNTSINFNSFQNGGQSAADALLRSWIDIPDIMQRNQGTRCGIYVIRDLDMRGAYKLINEYRSAS